MQHFEEALARSRAYGLFGQIFRQGLTFDLVSTVYVVPDLAAVLPLSFEPDEAAADHHRLFSLEVYPYASVFLDAAAHLGGAVARDVRHLLAQGGYGVDPSGGAPDHVGHELAYLAFLTAAEADAHEDGHATAAQRARSLQRRFIDRHLVWWLPAFTRAVQQQGHSFYEVLAGLTLDLVLDHRSQLSGGSSSASPLPAAPSPLDDPRTGLHDIAAFLTTTAWSGLYLSRGDIARLGRSQRVPHGFGARARTLANLLQAAATYDRLPPLLDQLADLVQAWQQHYSRLMGSDTPSIQRAAHAWLTRLEGTAALLRRLGDAARRAPHVAASTPPGVTSYPGSLPPDSARSAR